jgi:NitT/TauT family transport system permease protein
MTATPMTESRETEKELAAPVEGAGRADRIAQIVVPVVMLALVVLAWHLYVAINQVPHYVLPGPLLVAQALYNDWPILFRALLVTLEITFSALALALAGGVAIAIVMAQSRFAELALYPYAVILQVTPIIAVAPLIIIYAPTTHAALLIIAFLVAFFPVLSNTVQGLKSTDHNLLNLFELYGASPLQTLIHLKIPNALPISSSASVSPVASRSSPLSSPNSSPAMPAPIPVSPSGSSNRNSG